MAGFTPVAEARLLDAEVTGDHATVHVDMNPDTHLDVWIFCERHQGKWFDVGHVR